MLFRASAVVRPIVRGTLLAAKPSPVAARAFSRSARALSEHGAQPTIVGPGTKAGEVPSAYEQTTGIERLQLLGDIAGVDVFDYQPLDSSRTGTLTDPILVPSMSSPRLIGCTGSPADSHDVLWYELSDKKQRRCSECGSVYALAVHQAGEGQPHAH